MVRDQEVMGSNPVTPTKKTALKAVLNLIKRDLNMEPAVYGVLAAGKKTVRWTVLRVGRKGENPVTPTKKPP